MYRCVYDVSMHCTAHAWFKLISHRYEKDGCGKLAHGHHVVTLLYIKKNLNKCAYSAELYYHHFKALN